jgi:hypothetical protein
LSADRDPDPGVLLVDWRSKAEAKLYRHPAWPEIKANLQPAYEKARAALEDLERARQTAWERLQEGEDGIVDSEIAVPEAKTNGTPPATLFSTDDDFVTASLRLIADKALENTDDCQKNGDKGRRRRQPIPALATGSSNASSSTGTLISRSPRSTNRALRPQK